MFKGITKLAAMAAIAISIAACGGNVYAGTPTSVTDVNGQQTYPTGPALKIKKTTDSGNRVEIEYPTGIKYMGDGPAWTGYAQFIAGMGKPVLVPGYTNGYAIDVSKGIVDCVQGKSLVIWPDYGGQIISLDDNCAFRNAAKQ